MSSKREEERNEKIIRGLLKLPPNRRCINCNSLGPQYVCTNFWTFVCTACSGIHREFTHRVKSISMAKFTAQEAEALQNGGNQRARELFLKDWDMQSMRFPDSSYPDKIRAFIKNVYVDKKYAGGRSSDKPPRDPQGLKTHEEYRRASSYHSFSQSPPYDLQYEERRYGRPRIMLTRKPGSDNGHYEGNTSSILYSPDRDREHTYEDRFANESSGPRISDYSISSAGDPFRSGGQSPNMHSSPSKQISASSASFGSFDGKSLDPKSTNSGALSDMVFEPKHTSISPKPNKSTIASSEMSTPQDSSSNDLFSLQNLQQHTKTSVDFFADFSNQPTFLPTAENKPSSVPPSENEGWAMFDLVHHVAPVLEVNEGLSSGEPPHVEGSIEITDAFSSNPESSQWFLAQNSAAHGGSAPTADQWHADFDEIQNAADSMSHPVWNAFDDSFERNSSNLNESSSQESQIFVNKPSISGGYYTGVVVPKLQVLNEENLQMPVVLDNAPQIKNASGSQPSASLSCEVRTAQQWKSTNPFDLPYDLDPGTSNMFNISSLQGALPNAQLPNAYLDGLSQSWFPQNSASTFIPSIPKGLSHMGRHSPSSESPNVTSQGSVATGNPFA